MPRALGPEGFGVVTFAKSSTAACFVLTALGLDTYIRKEVTNRHEHSRDFFGGVYWLRLALSAVILAAMCGVAVASGRRGDTLEAIFCFGLGQVFLTSNSTSAAFLHATDRTGGVALMSVASKLLWAAGIGLGFVMGQPLRAVGVSFAVSELVKAVVLARLARRHLELPLSIDVGATRAVLVASLPFFLAQVSTTLSSRLDVTLLGYLAGDREAGLYYAAFNVAGLALLVTPLIAAVLTPLAAKAAAQSEEALLFVMRRALELVLGVAVPVTLALALGADLMVATIYGGEFAATVPTLRLMSLMFVLTFAAMVATTALVRLGRSWLSTWVTLGGVLVQVVLSVVLIPRFGGAGGAGYATALAVIVGEAVVAATLLAALGRRAFDARSLSRLARTAAVVATVVAIDRLLRGRAERLPLDALAYVVGAVVTGAVNVTEAVTFVKEALGRRSHR